MFKGWLVFLCAVTSTTTTAWGLKHLNHHHSLDPLTPRNDLESPHTQDGRRVEEADERHAAEHARDSVPLMDGHEERRQRSNDLEMENSPRSERLLPVGRRHMDEVDERPAIHGGSDAISILNNEETAAADADERPAAAQSRSEEAILSESTVEHPPRPIGLVAEPGTPRGRGRSQFVEQIETFASNASHDEGAAGKRARPHNAAN